MKKCAKKVHQKICRLIIRAHQILDSQNYFFYPILRLTHTDWLVFDFIINFIIVNLKFLLFPLFSLGFAGYNVIQACQNRSIFYAILSPFNELIVFCFLNGYPISYLYFIVEFTYEFTPWVILALFNLLYLAVCLAVAQQSFFYEKNLKKKYTQGCFSQYYIEQSEQEFEFLNKQTLKSSQNRSNYNSYHIQQQHQNPETFIDDIMYFPSPYKINFQKIQKIAMEHIQNMINENSQENINEDTQNEIIVQEKQWNHFFQLMEITTKQSTMHKKINFMISFGSLFSYLIFIIIILISRLTQKPIILFFNSIIYYGYFLVFHMIMQMNIQDTLRYIDTINVFTFLLERDESSPQKRGFTKYHSTINLYCIRSMRTWIEMRCFYFQELQNRLKKHNQFQLIEIIMILFTILIMFFDYQGTYWDKSYFLNSTIIIIIICSNTIQKFLCSILPTFITYSEANIIIQQSRTLIQQFITHLISLKSFLHKEVKEETEKQFYDKLDQLTYENSQLSIEIPQYDQFQISESNQKLKIQGINEIKRNTSIYGYYKSQNDQKAELEYMDDLIKMYENINLRMEENKANHVFKFLGMIEISYSKLPALIYFLLPPIFLQIFHLKR